MGPDDDRRRFRVLGCPAQGKIGAGINAGLHAKRLTGLADQMMRFILAAPISVTRDAGRVGTNRGHTIQQALHQRLLCRNGFI